MKNSIARFFISYFFYSNYLFLHVNLCVKACGLLYENKKKSIEHGDIIIFFVYFPESQMLNLVYV